MNHAVSDVSVNARQTIVMMIMCRRALCMIMLASWSPVSWRRTLPHIGHGVINPMAALTATIPEEEGIEPAGDEVVASDMPPPHNPSMAPMIVALAGSGGAIAALLLTLFIVHTIRRTRPGYVPDSRHLR
jgi:hypothetical protein